MSQSSIKLIFGAFTLVQNAPEKRAEFIEILKKHNVKDLDTARIYPGSEKILGELGAAKDFTIHTKAKAFVAPGLLQRDPLISSALFSLFELKTDQVDVYFLHAPDPDTPLEETVGAVQELYKAGKFKRFGLSNYTPEQVREVYDIAKKAGYVLPTVYQGNYNPVARRLEATLFPVLRELGIAFYAYSPLAGGFLTKKPDQITEGVKGGRFDKDSQIGKLYQGMYNRPALLDALGKWEALAKEAGTTQAGLAYRWVTHNSILKKEHGDGIIIGASRPEQLENTLKTLEEGPLPEHVAKAIDELWETIKNVAPLHNTDPTA